jgi:NAD(P)-dependent dehydrogenase (short-subunit alcohol dehydrogenase family)
MTEVEEPRLDGRVAFVAGASRGLGKSIAVALADAGARVVVAARSETPGKLPGTIHEVAAMIRERGGDALPVVCDVADEASVEVAVATAVEHYGGIDVLVANAAVLWLRPTLETPLSRWEQSLRVNLTGVFLVTRAVLPHVVTRGHGSLLALTTKGVRMTDAGSNAYWVSKAGVERYYTGLAAELRERNIAVNCLAPAGLVLTEGALALGIQARGRPTEEPESVARAALWLAVQDAHGLTGAVLSSAEVLERFEPRVLAAEESA